MSYMPIFAFMKQIRNGSKIEGVYKTLVYRVQPKDVAFDVASRILKNKPMLFVDYCELTKKLSKRYNSTSFVRYPYQGIGMVRFHDGFIRFEGAILRNSIKAAAIERNKWMDGKIIKKKLAQMDSVTRTLTILTFEAKELVKWRNLDSQTERP